MIDQSGGRDETNIAIPWATPTCEADLEHAFVFVHNQIDSHFTGLSFEYWSNN